MILAAQPSLQLSIGLCTGTIHLDIDTTLMGNRITVVVDVKINTLK